MYIHTHTPFWGNGSRGTNSWRHPGCGDLCVSVQCWEWMGCWGLLGWWHYECDEMDHSRKFPATVSTSKIFLDMNSRCQYAPIKNLIKHTGFFLVWKISKLWHLKWNKGSSLQPSRSFPWGERHLFDLGRRCWLCRGRFWEVSAPQLEVSGRIFGLSPNLVRLQHGSSPGNLG